MRTKIHRFIYVLGLIGVCVGMPSSNAITSISQAVLAINWMLEGNYLNKLKKFLTNKPAVILCSFYVMHLLGLLYTSNFNYGLEDINKKLPLFLFPFILSSSFTISEKGKRIILLFFMLALTVVSFIGGYLLIHHELVDIHDISPYIAPVRLAMMMVLSIFLLVSGQWSVVSSQSKTFRFSLFAFHLIWAAWFFFFLFVMQSLTAVIMAGIISLSLLFTSAVKAILKKNYLYGIGITALILLGISGSSVYVVYFYHYYFPEKDKINFSKLDKISPGGHDYWSDPTVHATENGHYVYQYLCPEEMKNVWNKRSKIPYDSNDLKGNGLRYTLIRYLASLGLRKDSGGVSKLTDKDIHAIELGIPNYQFNSLSSMSYRLYQVFWEVKEYEREGEINGHSVTMRLEYWRIALHLIREHPVYGVGTGDVRKAFDNYYIQSHSKLSPQWRLRAHNQYLEITVGFGLIGLVWFLISILYPAIKLKKLFTYAYFVFFIMIMLSFLTEDTLETEAGATFYAFFNSFFLFL